MHQKRKPLKENTKIRGGTELIVLVDKSFLIAAVDKSNKNHREAAGYLNKNSSLTYVIPLPSMLEACELIGSDISKEVEILFLKKALMDFSIELIENNDIERAIDIFEKYSALELSFTDAIFTAISERLCTNNILAFNKGIWDKIVPSGFRKFNIIVLKE
jgi:predicted nucleic acid-binding protein